MSKIHYLKIREEYYINVAQNRKKFELRKNDRNYQENDILAFHIIDCSPNRNPDPPERYVITNVFNVGDFIPNDDNYVILSIEKEQKNNGKTN